MKRYTCNDYRQEMMLAGLRKQLNEGSLDDKARKALENEIRRLEKQMGLE